MKKREIIIVALVAVVALLAVVFLKRPQKPEEEPKTLVAIQHGNNIVKEFDPTVDAIYEVTGDYSCVKKYSSEYEQVYRAYEKSVPVAKIMNIGDYYTDWHIALYNIWSGGNIEENLTMIEDDMKAQFEKK